MTHQLPDLPYSKNALEPIISERTIEFHYGKHHQTYVTKLNELIQGTGFENSTLEDLILKSDGAIFNNAAQVWNHTFYWNCLTSPGNRAPEGKLMQMIIDSFGSFENFKKEFAQAAATQFGSGWAWLVVNKEGKLEVTKTPNAENPMQQGLKPLLTCDVWEHAYYLDYQNKRPDYVEKFWEITDWEKVAQRL